MIQHLKEAFPNIEASCLKTITDKHTFVFEAETVLFVTSKDSWHLHIENKLKTECYFVQNDDCIMKKVKGGQCDYLICNDKDVFFTEVKVAKGNQANHRKDAYSQLENTFKHYSKLINFDSYSLNAVVCFPSKRRIVSASKSTKRKEFKDSYKLNLIESNYISFE
ncbi:hypothetical protein [Flavobacterium limi]|uniref:Nuclease-related domain-containing protein n=1 Tax=Flavobacterium limi TaxID=2045105 RepID=A0ABQ1THZ6_9FLAO|nr:hypothetical protein [Flavobacterium limi]GGE95007.1 hypothetical protein GCM10011518_00440 [Flavobacterium limi]